MRFPYHVYGGLQDNGTWEAPSRTLDARGVTNDEWLNVGGGDGFFAQADPLDWRVLYTESQGGAVARFNQATGERKSIRPRPETPGESLQFDWNSPILISPHNNKKLFFGGNKLFVSLDRGDTWRRTDDLTGKTDRTKLPILGKPVDPKKTLSANDGQDTFGSIVTISESPLKAGVVWVGSDDGVLQVSQDDGKTWTKCTVPGVPAGTYVSRVHASPHAAGRCYVSFDGHRSDNFTPYIFVTEDFGATWKKLSSTLPEGTTVSVTRDHPRTPNLLFTGTERGAYVSFNRGATWERFDKPFPASIPVDDIQVHSRDNDLIFATHARGIWILDDIGALEAKAQGLAPVTLAPTKPAVSYRIASRKATTGHKIYVAPNPTTGTPFRFYLDEKVKGAATLAIKDSKGKTVRTLTQAEPAAGWNLLRWDIRENPATTVNLGGGGFGGGVQAPRLLPGSYTAILTVGGLSSTQPLAVYDDPRSHLTDKERKEVHDTLAALRDTYGELDAARTLLTEKRTVLEKEPASPKRDAKLKEITDLLAEITPATGASPGAGRGGQGGGNPSAPANRRTPGTLRGNDPQAGNRPAAGTPPPVTGGATGSVGQPTPRPAPSNALTTRLGRVAQNIDALIEPLSPGNKKEAEEAIKAAKKAINAAKKLK
jgi:Sortilin, neurotensin receptor 3,